MRCIGSSLTQENINMVQTELPKLNLYTKYILLLAVVPKQKCYNDILTYLYAGCNFNIMFITNSNTVTIVVCVFVCEMYLLENWFYLC